VNSYKRLKDKIKELYDAMMKVKEKQFQKAYRVSLNSGDFNFHIDFFERYGYYIEMLLKIKNKKTKILTDLKNYNEYFQKLKEYEDKYVEWMTVEYPYRDKKLTRIHQCLICLQDMQNVIIKADHQIALLSKNDVRMVDQRVPFSWFVKQSKLTEEVINYVLLKLI